MAFTKVTGPGIHPLIQLQTHNIHSAGIITAAQYVGDGSELTGVSGFATAMSNDQYSILNDVFTTGKTDTVAAGTSVLVESNPTAGYIAFTRAENIVVATGATLTISKVGSGTTLKTDILFNNDGANADKLDGQDGSYYTDASNITGTIDNVRLPNPIVKNITGNVTGNLTGNADSATTAITATTATTAVNAQGLTGSPNIVVGVITANRFQGGVFAGDGSGLTGVTASGSGINVSNNGTIIGVAGTINFGSNLDVSAASAGIVTVTQSTTGIVTASKVHLGNLSGISTWTEDLVVVGDGRVTGILTIGEGSITIDPTAEEIKLGQTRLTRDSSGDIQIRDLAGNYKRLRGRRFRVETPNRASEGVEVGTGSTLTSPSDNVLVIRTNDEERLRVGAGGSVGIGTDNPDTLLHLYGESSTQKLITLGSGPSKRNNYIGINGADNLEIGADADSQGGNSSIRFKVDNTEMIRIFDDRIGIGTDADGGVSTLLQVYHPTADEVARFESGDSTACLAFKDSSTTSDRPIIGGKTDDIFIQTGGTEKFRFTSTGNLVIGEGNYTPGAAVHIKRGATSAPYPGIKIENTANNVGLLDFIGSRTGSNNTIGLIRAYWEDGSGGTTNVAGITFKSGSDTTNKDDGALQFLTSNSNDITQRMIIQPNGEIAMSSNGSTTITDALANLHIQNGSFRVSQATETGSIFKIQCHTDNQDGNRHKLAIWKNSGIPTLVSDCNGSLYAYASVYAGRTRSDANGPNNTYRHGSHGFYGYSSRTDGDANYRAGAFIRCWDAGDDADRNVIYITNSGDDTTTVDYDVHQKYGVKSSGMVHQTSHLWLGRVESDEGSPNSVYNGGSSQTVTIYSTSSSNYSQIRSRSSNNSDTCIDINTGGTGTVFKVTSNGQVKSDHGSAMGTPADYAEYFEWVDGNSSNVDRRGVTVVLDGKKVRPATGSDDTSKIIGVVSALPAVVGDSCWNAWQEKWLRDAYGSFITEEQEFLVWNKFGFTTNKEGVKTANPQPDITLAENLFESEEQILVSDIAAENAAGRCPQAAIDQNLRIKRQARKLNPSWDSTKSYEPREDRPEWDAIGLLGKLSVRRGQPIGSNWVKMEDNVGTDPNDSNIIIDKYLVR